jgi:hypothetical protein
MTRLAVAWCAVATAALQIAGPQQVFDQGLIIDVTEGGRGAGGYRHVIAVTRAGLPESRITIEVENQAQSVVDVNVNSSSRVSIVGRTTQGALALALLDVRGGRVLFQAVCRQLRLSDDKAYYLFTSAADGEQYVLNVNTGIAGRALSAVSGAVELLATGTTRQRRKVVAAIETSIQMRDSAIVRQSLITEFRRALRADRRDAHERPAHQGVRPWSQERDYLGELVDAVARVCGTQCLDEFVTVDHFNAIGALATAGREAVRPVVRALSMSPPEGYSMYYRSRLIDALVVILREAGVVDPRDWHDLRSVAARFLESPANWQEIDSALSLVDELGDDGLEEIVRQLASSAYEVRARGITRPGEIRAVIEKAEVVLSRHVDIR